MAIKFQYNKTSMQQMNKQLKMRVKALPTIKNKESALRVEVQKAKDKFHLLEQKLDENIKKYNVFAELWNEFDPKLVKVKEIKVTSKKIAGVKTDNLDEIVFEKIEFSLFNQPNWLPQGVAILKELISLEIGKNLFLDKMDLLNHARRKTTQKVNLYEKVQIPGYEEAIMKIKRFLEDKENLSKSAQKIVKNRQNSEL
ncbi:MAG: V-type ATP synthase subunit D [Bacteroidales bacterium]|nr:V-type ATP synthase subunit D [Bacteroidales bacterium]